MIGTTNPLIAARSILTTSSAVDAKLPAPVLAANARAKRVLAGSRSLFPGPDAVTVSLVDALDAGRDAASDPAVLRAYIGQQIGASGYGQSVEQIAGQQLRETFALHANAIVRSWDKPFTSAATTLTEAHVRLGDVSLEDTRTILEAGPAAAGVWAQAQKAATVLDQVVGAWVGLAGLTGFAPVHPHLNSLRIVDASADQLTPNLRGKQAKPWDVLCAGLSLSLADGPEFTRRVRAIEQQERAEASALEREAHDRATGRRAVPLSAA